MAPAVTVFGDYERADCYDADPTIAPEQVARFIHRLRVAVEALAGRELARRFSTLSRREQDDAVALGESIAEQVHLREPDNPAVLAERVVNRHATTTGGRGWDDLTPAERQIAIDLLDLVVDWLDRQGPR